VDRALEKRHWKGAQFQKYADSKVARQPKFRLKSSKVHNSVDSNYFVLNTNEMKNCGTWQQWMYSTVVCEAFDISFSLLSPALVR
jgi:hypothetical protein